MWLFPIIWDGVLCMYIPASYKQVFNSVAVTFQIFLPQEPPSKVSKAQFLDEWIGQTLLMIESVCVFFFKGVR